MRLSTAERALALLILLAASPVALGWSGYGHRLVGQIAQRHLAPATGRAVAQLLAGEPEPTLAGVADWADALRYTDPGRFKATSRWHYVEIADASCRYDAASDCRGGACVVGAIQAQRALLADRGQPDWRRREALAFLVHLVGDVHQPLHASHRPDRGGNRYQVSLRSDLPAPAYARDDSRDGIIGTNLHAVWDRYILAAPRLSADAETRHIESLPWRPHPRDTDSPAAWAGESCALAQRPEFQPTGHVMDQRYLDAQRPLAEQRIHQAGLRLARLLDQALGQQTP